MIVVKSPHEIDLMRKGGSILAMVLHEVVAKAQSGVALIDLDAFAEQRLRSSGGEPAFKDYHGYPSSLCISVNNEVVHGIPRAGRVLAEGNIVGFDLGLRYQGFCTDMAQTVGIGKISKLGERLITVTQKSLQEGLGAVKAGNRIGDIGSRVQAYVEKNDFQVVRSLVGHGVGRDIHEDPAVPNFGEKGTGEKLVPGMTLAIEPMVTVGDYAVRVLDDKWTVVTEDGSLSAHIERTIVVTEKGYEFITPW
ncbi:MAG: type I methionyl aminopeptidase [Parcubacteria group bacterium]